MSLLTPPPVAGQPGTKSDYAYGLLRQGILAGDYPPGIVLNQAQLADAIGISTTPLREALRRLGAEGLVELSSHRDARVSALTATEAKELLEMRNALDPLAIEQACRRRDQDDIRRIVAAHERLEEASRNAAGMDVRTHRDFHTVLYRTCHNSLLISTLDSLWDKAERYRSLGLRSAATSATELEAKKRRKSDEHADLVDCVLRGDADRAGELMRRHIQHSLVAQAIEQLTEDTGSDLSGDVAGLADV